MQSRETLARPYARAAYGAAQGSGHVDAWSQALAIAAEAVMNDAVSQQIQDPRLSTAGVVGVMTQIGESHFDEAFVNFLRVLAENDRLMLLPDIYAQFEALRRDAEARVYVHVLSAQPIEDDQSQVLAERLKQRFGREVDLDIEVDPDLIGGAIIRAGDEVIDGSVRGRLERLSKNVTL